MGIGFCINMFSFLLGKFPQLEFVLSRYFFIFGFQQFDYKVDEVFFTLTRLLSFLNLYMNLSQKIWTSQTLSLQIFFFLHQYFPFVSGTLMTYMLSLLIVFHRSFSSAQVFFSLSFTLSNVCWSILKFTDSLLCHLHSAAGPIAWMFHFRYYPFRASLVAHLVKNPPAMRETWLQSLGWEDPLEKGKATYSSILAWRIPWTVWPYGRRVGHDWATFIFTFCCTFQF